jgi:formylmethanofuran dehydrogenase subunit C
MRGGAILIDGRAGNEIGATMRRGLIAIGGATGDFTGVNLIAGTILVFGQAGIRLGANMKRGTLALFSPPTPLLPTFRYDCDYHPAFIDVYLRRLADWGFRTAAHYRDGSYRRFTGDLVSLGKGEVLCWQAPWALAASRPLTRKRGDHAK